MITFVLFTAACLVTFWLGREWQLTQDWKQLKKSDLKNSDIKTLILESGQGDYIGNRVKILNLNGHAVTVKIGEVKNVDR